MKLLSIVLISVATFGLRPTPEAHQFFKLDSPQAVAQVREVKDTTHEQKPVIQAEKAPENKPVPPPEVAPPPTCRADQWVRADNNQCLDKPKPAPAPAQPAPVVVQRTFGGNCESWIAGAGIREVASARELIRRESGCNPYARNPSSGACGVAQELPCGKSGCSIGDGACQVSWMNRYVLGRYGSWGAAVSFHDRNNWY